VTDEEEADAETEAEAGGVPVGGVIDDVEEVAEAGVSLRGLDGVGALGLVVVVGCPRGLDGWPLGLDDPLLEPLEPVVLEFELTLGVAWIFWTREEALPTFRERKAGFAGEATGLSPAGGFPHPGQYLIPALTSRLHQMHETLCSIN